MAKYLIIHMDDIGINDGTLIAAKELFQKGTVTSASVIIPACNAKEFCQWALEHTQYDIGIHSTVTCEWDTMRWTSLSPKNKVPSILYKDGYMVKGSEQELQRISVKDFEHETVEQMEYALRMGLRPSHLDNHLWTMRSSDEMLDMYLKLAKRYQVIPYIPKWSNYTKSRTEIVRRSGFRQADYDLGIPNDNTYDYPKKKAALISMLGNLKDGLNVLTIHPEAETEEVKKMITDYKNRVDEYQLLLEDDVEEALKSYNIILTTWKDIADLQQLNG